MIETTQFGRRMQSVSISTELLMDQANAGDPPYRCMIGGHRPTPHTPATLRVVADLRSGQRSIEVIPPTRISKHERDTIEDLHHQSQRITRILKQIQRIWATERLEN
jgi:hypothetical protein